MAKLYMTQFQKGHKPWNTGLKGFRKGANANENSTHWKGDSVGYVALHQWVRKNLIQPDFCQECNNVPPHDLANKGIYNRDFQNWEWLCRRCHMIKDGRMELFLSFSQKKKHEYS